MDYPKRPTKKPTDPNEFSKDDTGPEKEKESFDPKMIKKIKL